MRVKAVVYFDIEDSKIKDIINYHRTSGPDSKLVTDDQIIAYEIKQMLENEHQGLAEYESANVEVLSIQQTH